MDNGDQGRSGKDLDDIETRLDGIEDEEGAPGPSPDRVPELLLEPVEKVDIIKKILVIGDSGVGKKTILDRVAPFKKDWERYTQTIGTAITKYDHSYSFVTTDVSLLIIVWDVTGQSDYRRMAPSYYKGAEGLIVMADANDATSVENIPNWMKAAYKIIDKVPTVVIINKIDLVSVGERKALDRKVNQLLAGHEVQCFYLTKNIEMSALKEPFLVLSRLLTERIKLQLAKRRYKRTTMDQG